MTTYKTPIVAGVFKEETGARSAFENLRKANFGQDQVGVAMPGSPNVTDNLADDFMKLGVTPERANFYEHEFKEGRIVVSVRPDGREDEAKSILQNYGAYDYGSENISSPASGENQGWTGQGQPTNEAATDNYGQQDYRQGNPR